MTPDHQLARSTAEKIRALASDMVRAIHEQDREKSNALSQGFGDSVETIILTALQESNREVVAWKESALQVERSWDCQAVGKLLNLPLGSDIRANIESGIKTLRARLALADEMAKALEAAKLQLRLEQRDPASVVKQVEEVLRRWTAPQAGTTETIPAVCSLNAGTYQASEPASRAVPITPETVVPFPCWLWVPGYEVWEHCDERPCYGFNATHYHPDQPTAPTCRPTATEGGKV